MSGDLKSIALDKVFVDAVRTRPVDEDHALAIQSEIVATGFTDPILVRHTPRRKDQPYTLIDGAHRLRAMKLLDEVEILALVVEADKDAAAMMEAGANLFRHMTVLDRAMAVHAYRVAWERKYGKIKRGGDQRANLTLCPIDVIRQEAERGFSVACAERLGLSESSVKRSVRIAVGLTAELRDYVRSTPLADNQSALLDLCELSNEQQLEIVAAVSDGVPLKEAIASVAKPDVAPSDDAQSKFFKSFASAFQALDKRNAVERLKWAYEARPEIFEAAGFVRQEAE